MMTQVHTYPLAQNPFLKPSHSTSSSQRQLHSLRPPESSIRRKSREKKGTFLGIEVAESLHWRGWELGKEVTKHLTLKNVQLKTQKLQYSPPSTTFFSTLFPQPIVLSAGTSFSLPVTFHPLEKRDYEDCLRFETTDGHFSIVLRASLPRHGLLIPGSLHLPMCAVQDSSEGSFVMHNVGELRMSFNWEVPVPFLLIPTSGLLEPGEHGRIKVLFRPQAALVYDVMAICRFGDSEEHEKSIQLSSLAKYPHLLVRGLGEEEEEAVPEDSELRFGPVAVGCIVEKYIEVHNLSPVNASFHIEREKPSSPLDCVFFCDVTTGAVAAHGTLTIPLSFRPQTAGAESVDYFSVIPVGISTKAVMKVTGSCLGPSVTLHSPFVNFGLINLGQQVLHTLEIRNASDVPAHYQFDISTKESVFSFDRPWGVLAGNAKQNLRVTFCPAHPIAHYRRVACLIHHQDPLFLDLIGTCHSDEVKPAVLQPKHLSLYRTNMARGLTFYPPDVLSTMQKEGKLQMDPDGALLLPTQEEAACCEQLPGAGPSGDSAISHPLAYPHIHPMTELFEDGFSSDLAIFPPHVTVNIRDFDFGHCKVGQKGEPLPLSLTNHTKGKVTIVWTCSAESPFRVSPESIEIPPLKSTAFRLSFLPTQMDTLYGSELEAFASYKVLRNYRNVENMTLCPPWCLTIRAQGHTFEPGHQHFIPNCVLDSPNVLFPAVSEGSLSHRSLLLQNLGPSPLTFSLDQSSCPSISVKPSCGYVSPGAHQVLLLRTSPEGAATQKHLLPLQLNSCPKYTQEILLMSRVETPLLLLEGDGQLFFKPTCVGTSSERSYTLKNTSRLPLHFEWKIQHADSQVLSVNPDSGVILPNETLSQTWRFVPRKEIKYFAKASVYVWGAQRGLEPVKKARYTLRVIGEGATGTILAEREQLDLGNILVGGFQSHDLVLLNNGDCGLTYVLSVEQSITGPCDPDEVLRDPLALELEQHKGMIPARTKVILKVMARPARRAQYSWTISYTILTPEALDPANTFSERQLLCQAVAQGIYPSFSISDALPEGSPGCITKMQLWRLFNLETLNLYLERDPTPAELVYRVPTRHSTRRCPSSYTPVMLDFNFGAAPLGSDPFVALLMLQNRGQVPVDWAFLFPTDQQIELEYWAETGEFDPSELHQMRIQDNKLFTIAPKVGTLTPGQQQTVQLMYRHDFIGTDRLPVLLKVSYGREVLLNFIGVTVEQERRYVHFTSTKHQFTPVAIGTSSPPKQIYELFNGGSLPVIYEIQLDCLKEIQEQNFQHPVFQCLNPRGEIPAGMTAHVEWIFSPLEAKTYAVDIPVHILGGDSALITFQGIGYDQHALGRTGRFDDFSTSCVWTPGMQRLTLPGQGAVLSEQRVVFGDIPVYSKSSRLVFLNNTSESEAIFYSWYAASPIVSEALQVSPQTGVAQPGESTPCTITLLDYGQAAFYNMDLVCEVFLQKDLAAYDRELLLWEEEKERQAVEFTITEQDTIAEKKLKPQSRSSVDSAGTRKSSDASSVIRKYKTLPPIKHGTPDRSPANRNPARDRMEREARRLWARPEPPSPVQLHLGVTGRSHHIEDFMTHFSSDLAKHFIYRRPKEKLEQVPVGLQPETGEINKDLSKPSAQEVALAADIMTMVLRNLLDDVHFHEALTQGLDEPPPYFTQLASTDSAKASGSLTNLEDSIADTPTPLQTDIEEDEEEGARGQEEGQSHEADQGEEADSKDLWPFRKSQGPSVAGEEDVPGTPVQDLLLLSKGQEIQEKIKRLPAFGILVESILENTLQNILIEANRGEVVLTARPRIIALPPSVPK